MEDFVVLMVLALLAGFGIFFFYLMSGGPNEKRCPHCNHPDSFKKTGSTRKSGSSFSGTVFQEFKCSSCGHTEWEEKYSYRIGGGSSYY